MQSAEPLFQQFLKTRRLKYTSERMAILRAVAGFGRPFEAEELLLVLRNSPKRVSKATVYRTLKHLLQANIVKQVYFGGSKQSHYDFMAGEKAYDHLLDLETGRILPFSNELVVKLHNHIAKRLGYVPISHRFQITARRADKPNK